MRARGIQLLLFLLPVSIHAQQYDGWISNNWDLVKTRTLSEIVLMGSHDSGMSEDENCTVGADECNTRTQTRQISGQLRDGYRFFDMRPVFYNPEFGDNEWYLGHFNQEKIEGEDIVALGCPGIKLRQALRDVREFLDNNKELVILDFSHYFWETDPLEAPKTAEEVALLDQMIVPVYETAPFVFGGGTEGVDGLTDIITENLGNYLYESDGTKTLSNTTLEEMIPKDSTHGTALILLECVGSFSIPPGMYENSTNTTAAINIYNNYSGTEKLDSMVCDQKNKMLDFFGTGERLRCTTDSLSYDPPSGDQFLLSWTLTEDNLTAIGCGAAELDLIALLTTDGTLLNMAQSANDILEDSLKSWHRQKAISDQVFPSIILTDNATGATAKAGYELFQQVLDTSSYFHEIHHNPANTAGRSANEINQEFIEIINHNEPVNLQDWTLEVNGKAKHTFQEELVLGQGQALLIVESAADFSQRLACQYLVEVSGGTLGLGDVDGRVALVSPDGWAQDVINYNGLDPDDHASITKVGDSFVKHSQLSSDLSSPSASTDGTPLNGCEVILNSTKIDHFNSISVYPNPANNQISLTIAPEVHAHTVELLDITGKLVSGFNWNNQQQNTSTLDLSNLSKGLYVLLIRDRNNRYIHQKKLVVE